MMRKYVKIMVLALLMVGLVSGSAFAAASLNAGNTTVSAETIPVAGASIPAVNTAYQPAGAVGATSQLKISLTNGTFDAATSVTICDTLGVDYGTGVVAAAPANTSVTITTIAPLSSGTAYNLQPVIAGACAVPISALTNVNIAAGAVGGAAVSMTVDNALVPGDTNIYATGVVTTLVDQLSAVVITPAADVIDFAAVPTMTAFKTGLTTSTANIVILSNETLGTPLVTGLASNVVCGPWGGGVDSLKFTVTPGTGTAMGSGFIAGTAFTGGAAAAVIDGTIAATDANASGNLVLTAAPELLCGTGTSAAAKLAAATPMILTVNGTTALTARSYKLAVDTVLGPTILAAARNILAATTAWTWSLDATQYYIPLIGSNATGGRETYIKLQSKSSVVGSNGVSIAILANDGTIVATWSGTITAGTPLTVTGAELVAAATAAGKVVDGAAGFAVIVTVNATEADVFAYANMIDAAGAKRLPVKTVAGTIVE